MRHHKNLPAIYEVPAIIRYIFFFIDTTYDDVKRKNKNVFTAPLHPPSGPPPEPTWFLIKWRENQAPHHQFKGVRVRKKATMSDTAVSNVEIAFMQTVNCNLVGKFRTEL